MGLKLTEGHLIAERTAVLMILMIPSEFLRKPSLNPNPRALLQQPCFTNPSEVKFVVQSLLFASADANERDGRGNSPLR